MTGRAARSETWRRWGVLAIVVALAVVTGLLIWYGWGRTDETYRDAGRYLRDRQRMVPRPQR